MGHNYKYDVRAISHKLRQKVINYHPYKLAAQNTSSIVINWAVPEQSSANNP